MMGIFRPRAGLWLGAAAALCVLPAAAQDIRTNQSLLESGLFLSQSEAEAVLARLDADRGAAKRPIPNALAFWEQGATGYGQADRGGRIGYGGSATQFRLGGDREVRSGLVVGALGGAGFGSLGSGPMSAGTLSAHGDVYFRATEGRSFFKGAIGASQFDHYSIAIGDLDARCRGQSRATALRVAGQVGASLDVMSVKVSPAASLTLHETSLKGFDVRGDNGGLSFAARRAAAAIGAVRLTGSRSVEVAAGHKVDLQAFVGADEVAAFSTDRLRARAGETVASQKFGAPNGRGVVGGVGVGTAISTGVNLNVNYDYSSRDGVATRAARAKLDMSF